jgi:hypothetical protein
MRPGCVDEQSRGGLAAAAMVPIVMRAHDDLVDIDSLTQSIVHLI